MHLVTILDVQRVQHAQTLHEPWPLFHENVGNCFLYIGFMVDSTSHITWEMTWWLGGLVIPALATEYCLPFHTESLGSGLTTTDLTL